MVWLNELRELSEDFLPPAKEAMLRKLTLGPGPGGGGKMTLEGLAGGTSTIAELEEGLRDKSHHVKRLRDEPYRGEDRDGRGADYSRRFTSLLLIDAEEP